MSNTIQSIDSDRFYWLCPFCQNGMLLHNNDVLTSASKNIENRGFFYRIETEIFSCPNPDCDEFQIISSFIKSEIYRSGAHTAAIKPKCLHVWNLRPTSNAKPFPSYIPEHIRKDYEEACTISNLSPKASATLARRCLQGIIRDFHKITKGRLVDEIDAIEDKVDSQTWTALQAARTLGNIGAHPENDINTIVDVEKHEVDLMITLIEMLIKEWYIARHNREENLKKLTSIGAAKIADKKKTTA